MSTHSEHLTARGDTPSAQTIFVTSNNSDNSSINSSNSSITTPSKNRPPPSAYIKSHKNITFSYASNAATFQHGQLGDTDTYLVGTVHLNYGQPRQIRSVILHLRGAEKTSWYKAQARSKALYVGEHILVDNTFKIWEAEDQREIQTLDVPFKVKLPYNLPETINTDIGTVNYVLRATVNRKGTMVMANNQIVEVNCPLKKTLAIDNQNNPNYKLRGESRSGLDYTFLLPPNKSLNLGTYVTIPMRIRFLKPGISVERVEIQLKTCMDFRCNNPNETRHIKEPAAALIVPRQEIRYEQPTSKDYDGECHHTINLFIPRSVQPTYSGRFISITHQLQIKFCLWGADMDFQVEEGVRVANILEKHPVTSENQVHLPAHPPPATTANNPPTSNPAILQNHLAANMPPPPPPIAAGHRPMENVYGMYPVSSTSVYNPQIPLAGEASMDPRDFKLRGIDPRFLAYGPLTDSRLYQGNQHAMQQSLQHAHYQQQLQAQQLQAQHPRDGERRPSQSTMDLPPPPFPYDGYAATHLKNQFTNNQSFFLHNHPSLLSHSKNAYDDIPTLDAIIQYRQNLVALNKKLNNNRPAAPKTPPVHPPPPVSPITSILANTIVPPGSELTGNNEKSPPYQPYQTPLSPPPYRAG
ncbi:5976_t:CDS:2 [Ambispora leptoticha]|uniref:5976_t:CDS:1 n=1 Tax=Ambispora leptoticha TaxID=144679 RepID=A0A9N8WDN9_9GLOM|nr:5976_t:CDS:2 [Ambispora leptoticha]